MYLIFSCVFFNLTIPLNYISLKQMVSNFEEYTSLATEQSLPSLKVDKEEEGNQFLSARANNSQRQLYNELIIK